MGKLRRALREAVVVRGKEKYMSRGGKYYHYDSEGVRTEITEDVYNSAVLSKPKRLTANRKAINVKGLTPKEIIKTMEDEFGLKSGEIPKGLSINGKPVKVRSRADIDKDLRAKGDWGIEYFVPGRELPWLSYAGKTYNSLEAILGVLSKIEKPEE